MQCQSCGALLSYGTTKCPSCGANIQADESNSPYEVQEEAIPFIDYPVRKTAATSTPMQQTVPFIYGVPQVPAQSTAIPPGTSLSSHITVAPQQPVGDDLQPRRSISAGVAAVLVILAFLLVGGGGFGYYLAKVQPAELNAQATAVVQHVLTAQAQASAEAIAAFTAQSPQQIYMQITSRQPNFSDSLSQSDNNWLHIESPSNSCIFSRGTYHAIEVFSPGYNLCLAPFTNYSNFAYQVHMTYLRGDGGGLLFRMDYKHYTFYRFNIGRNGTYTLYVRNHNAPEKILADGLSPTISTVMNQSTAPSFRVTIIAFGKYIYVYVNGQFLTLTRDTTIDAGVIGLTASADTQPTEIAFSNAEIWIL